MCCFEDTLNVYCLAGLFMSKQVHVGSELRKITISDFPLISSRFNMHRNFHQHYSITRKTSLISVCSRNIFYFAKHLLYEQSTKISIKLSNQLSTSSTAFSRFFLHLLLRIPGPSSEKVREFFNYISIFHALLPFTRFDLSVFTQSKIPNQE